MGVLLINTVMLIVTVAVAIITCAIGAVVGFNLGIAHRKKIAEAEFGSAEEKAKSIIADAEKSASAKKRELLLEAKGFEGCIVSISDGTADVVVNEEELDDAKRAQIEDIVKRKTDISGENIVITPQSYVTESLEK